MRRRKFLVLFLVGLVIIAGVLYFVGFEEVLLELVKLDFKYFVAFLVIQLALMFMWALKWWLVLRQHNVSFFKVLPVSFFGYLMNNMTPMSNAGGEPFRAYVLAKVEDIKTEDSAASVVVDLFLETFPMLVMICIAIIISLTYDIHYLVALILVLAGLVVLGILVFMVMLITNERVSSAFIVKAIHLVSLIPIKFLREHAADAKTRIDGILSNYQSSMKASVKDNRVLYVGVLLASLVWVLHVFRLYLIFHMLGVELPLSALIMVRVGIAALSFISIIPGGLGIWEGGSTWLLTLFGVPASTGMAASLVERLFLYWIGNLIGLAGTVYIGATNLLGKYFEG